MAALMLYVPWEQYNEMLSKKNAVVVVKTKGKAVVSDGGIAKAWNHIEARHITTVSVTEPGKKSQICFLVGVKDPTDVVAPVQTYIISSAGRKALVEKTPSLASVFGGNSDNGVTTTATASTAVAVTATGVPGPQKPTETFAVPSLPSSVIAKAITDVVNEPLRKKPASTASYPIVANAVSNKSLVTDQAGAVSSATFRAIFSKDCEVVKTEAEASEFIEAIKKEYDELAANVPHGSVITLDPFATTK